MQNVLNFVIQGLAIVLTAGVYYAWQKYIRPYLVDNDLYKAAEVAVYAAEGLFGRYNGKEKLTYALGALKEQGWDVDAQAVIDAVRATWAKMDLKQIEAGVKDNGASGSLDKEGN